MCAEDVEKLVNDRLRDLKIGEVSRFCREVSRTTTKASYGMCRTRLKSLKGDPGTCQFPKGNHSTGYAEHARSPSRGTLALMNLQREMCNQNTGWSHKQFTSQYAN
ncbi:hypothetical protein L3X38_011174 [Prunus dulcis]|uniref:Uncharacterized protein n=1 Tax=Prunus dulcis TaxID=3755 RepID=A0AAD4ZFG6_PRUDU|nr:hypothetical protein L3X38_011174 [Prunus dulcis]